MSNKYRYPLTIAFIVALGGFLMGFDASVISGVVKFIEPEFGLDKIQLGWSVASLAFAATFAMLAAGPVSDRYGRKTVLAYAAVLFFISAIGSAVAPTFLTLVIARMVGGLGVGAALIIAPMYIAEISPAKMRGRMVSINQLNIVIGISVAFLTNYLVLKLGQSDLAWAMALRLGDWNWRWMLGLEALPAILYFFGLFLVPESPRWLIMHGRDQEALVTMTRISGAAEANLEIANIQSSIKKAREQDSSRLVELFHKPMRLVLTIGLSVAILQQITGINSVFFYAPMIFEQSGIGTNASYLQAILVGLTNLVFTLAAIALIDRIGRKKLLVNGVAGIAICMFLLSYGFSPEAIDALPQTIDHAKLSAVEGTVYSDDLSFKRAMAETLGEQALVDSESELVAAAIHMNPRLILVGILGFVASFAISIGPVMWVLFSELFPNRIRGLAISFVGFVNSAVSFLVQLVFPWELANFGTTGTFLVYGIFALAGLVIIVRLLPETKDKSLEELEEILVRNDLPTEQFSAVK
jgi:sugar porter (SP) family MFS transporter